MTAQALDEIPLDFGEYLEELLDEYDMSRKEFAYKIGVSDSYVGYWLRGQRLPPRESPIPIMIATELQLTTEKRKILSLPSCISMSAVRQKQKDNHHPKHIILRCILPTSGGV